ncbi:hypothetical protein [Arcicella rigui]|uniref:Uncharacterized protein n=1 Tax=Arcicella rigui TaxID=797020 RepID=A0ABU5QA86_9BACT|nr:hypothetical protein [Arcicella rigui]MEA5139750.1 hypothetical protein [Arcicella rigui]
MRTILLKTRLLLFIFFASFFFSACQKDDVLSDGEKVANELKSKYVGYNFNVVAYSNRNTSATSDTQLNINGIFITVGNTTYNLDKLISYRYDNTNSIASLILYFE